ncbi:MAG: hypothetical protein MUC97_04380 [Bernardetiaceae bacterium]|jgi:hypothetical protein|nr:hypothetical protein [Bernardetiaceae bacterium]
MDFKKLGDAFKEGADKLQKKGSEVLAKIDLPGFQEIGQKAVNDTVNEFNESVPLFPEAGYRLSEFEVELSLPPNAKAHFELIEDVSPEKKAAIMEKAKALGRLSELLFSALFKANDLQNTIKVGNLKLREIEVEIGLIPAVIVKFQPSFKAESPVPPPVALPAA